MREALLSASPRNVHCPRTVLASLPGMRGTRTAFYINGLPCGVAVCPEAPQYTSAIVGLRSLDFDHPVFENRTVDVIILGIAGDHARCLRVNGDLSMEYADAAAERGDQIGRMKPFFHGAMRHPD